MTKPPSPPCKTPTSDRQPQSAVSNRSLLQRYVTTRNEDAFRAIVVRYGPMVLGLTRRVLSNSDDAEDAMQLTFADLARRAGTVERPDCLASWLHTVAYQNALAIRRRRHGFERLATDPVDPRLSLDDISQRSDLDVLSEELDRLPVAWREPMVLRYLAELSNDETAERLGTTVSSIEGRLKRAKMLLRVRLLRRGVSLAALAAWLGPARLAGAANGAHLNADYWTAVGETSFELASRGESALASQATGGTTLLTTPTLVKASVVVTAAVVIITFLIGEGQIPSSIERTLTVSTLVAAEPTPESSVAIPNADAFEDPGHFYRHWVSGDAGSASTPQEGIVDPFQIGVSLGKAELKHVPPYFPQAYRVELVVPGSPADRAGLEVGDLLLRRNRDTFSGETPDAPFRYSGPRARTQRELYEASKPGATLNANFDVLDRNTHEIVRVAVGTDPLPNGVQGTKAAQLKVLLQRKGKRSQSGGPFKSASPTIETSSLTSAMPLRAADSEGRVNHYFTHWGLRFGVRPDDPDNANTTWAPDPTYNDPFQLGFSLRLAPPEAVPAYYPQGFVIEKVAPGSPVDIAGIQPGDFLLSWNNMLFEPNTTENIVSGDRESDLVRELNAWLNKVTPGNGMASWSASFDILDQHSGLVVPVYVAFGATAGYTPNSKARNLRTLLDRQQQRTPQPSSYEPTADETEIANKLAEATTFQLTHVTLPEAMRQISQQIAVDIVIDDHACDTLGIRRDETISPYMRFDDTWTMGQVIYGFAQSADRRLTYAIRNGAVHITPVQGAIRKR